MTSAAVMEFTCGFAEIKFAEPITLMLLSVAVPLQFKVVQLTDGVVNTLESVATFVFEPKFLSLKTFDKIGAGYDTPIDI